MLIEYNNSHPLGQNLCFLRKKYCLSYRALSRLLGISEVRLKKLEEGTAQPVITDSILKRLCQIFDIKPEDLFYQTLQ